MRTLNSTFRKESKIDRSLCLISRTSDRSTAEIERLALPQLQSEIKSINEFVQDSVGNLCVRFGRNGDFQELRKHYYWICTGIALGLVK